MGNVDEIAHDHFFLRGAVVEIVQIMMSMATVSDGYFTVAQLRDRLDNGRKVAIQILEFFDRHGSLFAMAIFIASIRTGLICSADRLMNRRCQNELRRST